MIVVEQLIFNILAFMLFVIMFLEIIRKNDTSYVIALVAEAIGIGINFIELITTKNLPVALKILVYMLSVFLPIGILLIEKKGISFTETISIIKVKVLLLLKNDKSAKKVLINLVTKYPSSYIGHKVLGKIYEKEGGIRKAIDEYAKAIDIDEKDYNSYYKIADLLNSLEKKDEAVQTLNNLLQKKPDLVRASRLLGDILISQEKYKEAAYIYNDALKYSPTDYDLNYSLGIVYTMLNDFQNARIYYEKSANLNSLEYNSKYNLAEIALIYKELETAEQNFLEATQDPDLEADAYLELSRISLIRGEKEKAIQYANIALESDPRKIAEKIKNDESFIIILSKLTIPLNLENIEEKESNIDRKNQKVKEHLEKTSEIARNLGYEDVKLSKYKERKEEQELIEPNEDKKILEDKEESKEEIKEIGQE